ncbi:hypothetical protein V6Z12_D03G071100 [Gossypium hirsutum]
MFCKVTPSDPRPQVIRPSKPATLATSEQPWNSNSEDHVLEYKTPRRYLLQESMVPYSHRLCHSKMVSPLSVTF